MTPQLFSISGLATEFELDRRTVAKRLRHVEPAKVRGRAKLYRLADAAAVLLEHPRDSGRRSRSGFDKAQFLEDIALPMEFLCPWIHDRILTLPEYERSLGIDDGDPPGETLDWLVYGFPLLPREKGSKAPRVSVPHADLWRLLFGSLIETLGGRGDAVRLGEEMRRIRGLAPRACE